MNTLEGLIQSMKQDGTLSSPSIEKAFRRVDRKYFVTTENSENIYYDGPLSIGYGQTISQPSTVAIMLEALSPQKGDKILDIGSGSAWTTALLAHIVGTEGNVIGIERIPELVTYGQQNLDKFPSTNAEIRFAETGLGIPDKIFDRILVSAAAEEFPHSLLAQVQINGKIVIPVQHSVYVVNKESNENFHINELYGFRFVPLCY